MYAFHVSIYLRPTNEMVVHVTIFMYEINTSYTYIYIYIPTSSGGSVLTNFFHHTYLRYCIFWYMIRLEHKMYRGLHFECVKTINLLDEKPKPRELPN